MSVDNLAAVEIPEAPGGNVGSNPWTDLLRMGQGVKEKHSGQRKQPEQSPEAGRNTAN